MINSKAVNKLSMAVLITSSLLLGGCGSNENDKPKENTPTDVVKKNDGKVQIEEMTKEETKKLTEGQFIDKINDYTLKVPNREVLETMGLDYEVEYNSYGWSAEDKEKDKTCLKEYMYEYENISLKERKFEYEGSERIGVDVVSGIKIVPIIYVGESDISDDLIKIVQLTNTNYETELLNPENYELLEKMLLEKVSFNDKKEETRENYL